VPLPTLPSVIARYGDAPYLVTAGPSGAPRVLQVRLDGVGASAWGCTAGRSAVANVAARPQAVLIFASLEGDGFSLLVDVDAAAEGDRLVLTPTSAVLHRPAPPVRA